MYQKTPGIVRPVPGRHSLTSEKRRPSAGERDHTVSTVQCLQTLNGGAWEIRADREISTCRDNTRKKARKHYARLGDAIDAAPRCNKRDSVAGRPQLAFVLDGVNFWPYRRGQSSSMSSLSVSSSRRITAPSDRNSGLLSAAMVCLTSAITLVMSTGHRSANQYLSAKLRPFTVLYANDD